MICRLFRRSWGRDPAGCRTHLPGILLQSRLPDSGNQPIPLVQSPAHSIGCDSWRASRTTRFLPGFGENEIKMVFRLRGIRRMQHRLIAAVVAIAALIGSLPLQVSVGPAKDLSKPFPCQHRACGCRSAEQCARQCCCFTPAQKRAWATQHGVTLADAPQPAAAVDRRSCCHRPTAAPRTSVVDRRTDARCATHRQNIGPTAGRPARAAGRFQLQVTAESRHCQGLPPLWTTLGDLSPPEPPVTAKPLMLICGRMDSHSESIPDASVPPPIPPPRIVIAPIVDTAA